MTDNQKNEDRTLWGSLIARTTYARKIQQGINTLDTMVENATALEGESTDEKYRTIVLGIGESFAINEIDFEPTGLNERFVASTQHSDQLKAELFEKRRRVFSSDVVAKKLGVSASELEQFAETTYSAMEFVSEPTSWDTKRDGITNNLLLPERERQLKSKLQALETVLDKSPKLQKAALGLAKQLHIGGRPELAMEVYTAIKSTTGETKMLARANLGEAVALTKLSLKRRPARTDEYDVSVERLTGNAWTEMAREDLKEYAANRLITAIFLEPEMMPGLTLGEQKLLKRAFSNDQKERTFTTPEFALFSAAQSLSQGDKFDNPERLISYALSFKPELTDVAVNLARHYTQTKDFEAVDRVIEGITLVKSATEEEVTNPIDEVLSSDPKMVARSAFRLGHKYSTGTEKRAQIDALFRKTLSLNVEGAYEASEVWTYVNRIISAEDPLLQAIQTDRALVSQFAKLLRDSGDKEGCIYLCQKTNELDPENHHAHYFAATAHEQLGQFQKATTEYRLAGNGSSAKAGLERVNALLK